MKWNVPRTRTRWLWHVSRLNDLGQLLMSSLMRQRKWRNFLPAYPQRSTNLAAITRCKNSRLERLHLRLFRKLSFELSEDGFDGLAGLWQSHFCPFVMSFNTSSCSCWSIDLLVRHQWWRLIYGQRYATMRLSKLRSEHPRIMLRNAKTRIRSWGSKRVRIYPEDVEELETKPPEKEAEYLENKKSL